MPLASIGGAVLLGSAAANIYSSNQQGKVANKGIDAQTALSEETNKLARDQFDAQQALVKQYSPLYQSQIQADIDAQTKNTARSDQQWQQYQDNFQPINTKIADTALNYDTQARRDQAAADARAGVAGTFDTARMQQDEALQGQGISLSSGKGLALANNLAIAEAKAKASAAAGARNQVEATGQNLLSNAANVGHGLTATGLNAGAQAQSNGQAAIGTVGGLSNLTGAGYNSALQGINQSANLNMNATNLGLGAQAAKGQAWGDLFNTGAGLLGMFSSEKLKDMGDKVDGKEAQDVVSASPAKHWAYKPGLGDGSTQPRLGPTAESLEGTPVSDGTKIDIPSMLGLQHAALGESIKDIKALKKEVRGLKSARKADAPAHPAHARPATRKGLSSVARKDH